MSGPVFEMLGIRICAFLGEPVDEETTGWNEAERLALQAKIRAREPLLNFAFSRANGDGSQQHFRVSSAAMP